MSAIKTRAVSWQTLVLNRSGSQDINNQHSILQLNYIIIYQYFIHNLNFTANLLQQIANTFLRFDKMLLARGISFLNYLSNDNLFISIYAIR